MAITNNDIKFLFYCKKLGASFQSTLMLGRLNFYGSKEYIAEQIAYFKNNEKPFDEIKFKDAYSEPFFELLGAGNVQSMDFSDYERASIIHDLNNPVPEAFHNNYDAIIDGGTIEHVFNFPVAISNCMKMLKTGGHYIGITPVNNLMGHGFYQFSPELYYRVFSAINGFEVVKMVITACNAAGNFDNWYEVADPDKTKSRVTLSNQLPTYLMVLAKKKESVAVFATTPQQSDYTAVWATATSKDKSQQEGNHLLKNIYRMVIPVKLRDILYAVRQVLKTNKGINKDLGAFDETHFRKMDNI